MKYVWIEAEMLQYYFKKRHNSFYFAKHVSTILLSPWVAINAKYKVEFIMLHRMLISLNDDNNNKKHDNAWLQGKF